MPGQWKRGDYIIERNLNRKTQDAIDASINKKFGGGPSNSRTRILATNTTGSSIAPGGIAAIDITDGTAYGNAGVDPVVSLSVLTANNLNRACVATRQMLSGDTANVVMDGIVIAPVLFSTVGDEYAFYEAGDTILKSSTVATRHRILFIGEDFGTDTKMCVVQFNTPDIEKIFRFKQSNADFLAAGEYFDHTWNVDGTYEIREAIIHSSSGTFTTQLEIGGTLTGPSITESSTNPIDMQDPTSTLSWDIDTAMRLKVIASDLVYGFELVIKAALA